MVSGLRNFTLPENYGLSPDGYSERKSELPVLSRLFPPWQWYQVVSIQWPLLHWHVLARIVFGIESMALNRLLVVVFGSIWFDLDA